MPLTTEELQNLAVGDGILLGDGCIREVQSIRRADESRPTTLIEIQEDYIEPDEIEKVIYKAPPSRPSPPLSTPQASAPPPSLHPPPLSSPTQLPPSPPLPCSAKTTSPSPRSASTATTTTRARSPNPSPRPSPAPQPTSPRSAAPPTTRTCCLPSLMTAPFGSAPLAQPTADSPGSKSPRCRSHEQYN